MVANDTQVGGQHYKVGGEEHWDRAWRLKWDPFQYQITKYVERWKNKNGVEDLKKARHFLQKYIELVERDIPVLAKGDIEIMLAVPATLTYEGGTFVEDLWQCRICHLHMRSKRGELPHHNNAECVKQQGINQQNAPNMSNDRGGLKARDELSKD